MNFLFQSSGPLPDVVARLLQPAREEQHLLLLRALQLRQVSAPARPTESGPILSECAAFNCAGFGVNYCAISVGNLSFFSFLLFVFALQLHRL